MKSVLALMFCTLSVSTFTAHADDLKGSQSKNGYWGSGQLIGRKIKGSTKGFFVTTYEMEINHGGLTDSARYQGSTVAISTKSRDIFEQFQNLDPKKDYIFEYEAPYFANPVWEDTHYLVTGIREMKSDFEKSGLPEKIETYAVRTGGYGKGEKTGVITDVMRWGKLDYTCTVQVNLGGHSQKGKEEDQFFDIYGEKNCEYAENLLPYGKEVKIGYSEDVIEYWDDHAHIIHTIEPIIDTGVSATTPHATKDPEPKRLECLDYEQVRAKLMQDPEFQEFVKSRGQIKKK